MKAKWILGVGVAVVAAALLWREVAPSSPDAAVAAALPSADSAARSASSGVVGARRGEPLMPPIGPAVRTTAGRRALSGEFAVAKADKARYDRLNGTPEGQTAEGQFALYRILRACANVTDRRFRPPRPGADSQAQRDAIAALPDTDPNKQRRLVALDTLGGDHCEGLDGLVDVLHRADRGGWLVRPALDQRVPVGRGGGGQTHLELDRKSVV